MHVDVVVAAADQRQIAYTYIHMYICRCMVHTYREVGVLHRIPYHHAIPYHTNPFDGRLVEMQAGVVVVAVV